MVAQVFLIYVAYLALMLAHMLRNFNLTLKTFAAHVTLEGRILPIDFFLVEILFFHFYLHIIIFFLHYVGHLSVS